MSTIEAVRAKALNVTPRSAAFKKAAASRSDKEEADPEVSVGAALWGPIAEAGTRKSHRFADAAKRVPHLWTTVTARLAPTFLCLVRQRTVQPMA